MENQTNFVNIRIQDHTGDRKLRLSWDTGDSESAKIAQEKMKEMFLDLQKEGYRFFACKKVLGVFPKKGREVQRYDPKIGELFYEASSEPKESGASIVLEEIPSESEKVKYEEPKKFDPKKENVDTSRDYVATKTMRSG